MAEISTLKVTETFAGAPVLGGQWGRDSRPVASSYLSHRLEAIISIQSTEDIAKARREGERLAAQLGFSESKTTLVTTAISELARNILFYAQRGEISLSKLASKSRRMVIVTAIDRGPGIADLDSAMKGGFSTSGGMGLGLSGLNHIMDSFDIDSRPGEGTRVAAGIYSD